MRLSSAFRKFFIFGIFHKKKRKSLAILKHKMWEKPLAFSTRYGIMYKQLFALLKTLAQRERTPASAFAGVSAATTLASLREGGGTALAEIFSPLVCTPSRSRDGGSLRVVE